MRDYGAEIVLSTAEFWGSRAEWHAEHKDYEITNVIGPDEWHEHVNNNAFTNYMAKWNIKTAIKMLEWLHSTAPAKAEHLKKRLNLTEKQIEQWQDVANNMHIPQEKETGLIEQ